MRREKFLTTMIFMRGDMVEALRSFGYTGTHNQFTIVCKCSSMADANRKCETAGLGEKVFKSDYCSETANPRQIDACENSDIAFGIEQSGKVYVTISELQEKVKEIKKARLVR